MKNKEYGEWSAHPDKVDWGKVYKSTITIWEKKSTKHEGDVLYFKLWNFWVRAGVSADLRSSLFFRDYEQTNSDSKALLQDVGFSSKKAETEEEVWQRIGLVWDWLRNNVSINNSEYSTIPSVWGS